MLNVSIGSYWANKNQTAISFIIVNEHGERIQSVAKKITAKDEFHAELKAINYALVALLNHDCENACIKLSSLPLLSIKRKGICASLDYKRQLSTITKNASLLPFEVAINWSSCTEIDEANAFSKFIALSTTNCVSA